MALSRLEMQKVSNLQVFLREGFRTKNNFLLIMADHGQNG